MVGVVAGDGNDVRAVVDRLFDEQRGVGGPCAIPPGHFAIRARLLVPVGQIVGVEGSFGRDTESGRHQDLRDGSPVIEILGVGGHGAGGLVLDVRSRQLRDVRIHVPIDHRDDRSLPRVALRVQGIEAVVAVVLLVRTRERGPDGVGWNGGNSE